MELAIIHSRACVGVEAPEVTVEVHISIGCTFTQLYHVTIKTVGLEHDKEKGCSIS